MKKLTIKEFARAINMSVSTVSKALRDSHEISSSTKQKVVAMAEELQYHPNPYASSLRRKKSKTIAVILPEVADSFFSLAINGIQAVAEQKGYHVLIYLSHDKYQNEKAFIDDCGSGRVDGVLISVSQETVSASHLRQLQSGNVPVVFFDRSLSGFETASVETNDFECGYIAAQHLLQNGCRNISMLSISGCLSICQKRTDGFLAALEEAISKDETISGSITELGDKHEMAMQQIADVLQNSNSPDGIVASAESVAIQVYLATSKLGVAIPQQLKVVAFSTLETAEILNPSLTTITQPAFDIGKTAAEILFKAIEKPQFTLADEHIILPSRLVKRQSSTGMVFAEMTLSM